MYAYTHTYDYACEYPYLHVYMHMNVSMDVYLYNVYIDNIHIWVHSGSCLHSSTLACRFLVSAYRRTYSYVTTNMNKSASVHLDMDRSTCKFKQSYIYM